MISVKVNVVSIFTGADFLKRFRVKYRGRTDRSSDWSDFNIYPWPALHSGHCQPPMLRCLDSTWQIRLDFLLEVREHRVHCH